MTRVSSPPTMRVRCPECGERLFWVTTPAGTGKSYTRTARTNGTTGASAVAEEVTAYDGHRDVIDVFDTAPPVTILARCACGLREIEVATVRDAVAGAVVRGDLYVKLAGRILRDDRQARDADARPVRARRPR